MRLFLQINVTDWKEQSYEKPLLSFASSLADDLLGADLDSQSEQYVAELVGKLADQAKSIFLLVIGKPGVPLGIANVLLNKLLRDKEKISQAVLMGQHEYAAKMLHPFGPRFKQEDSEERVKELISLFAGSSFSEQ